VFVSRGPYGCSPFAVHSVLPYNKLKLGEIRLGWHACAFIHLLFFPGRLEYPHPRERARVRANSMSLQLELDGIELGDSSTVSLHTAEAPIHHTVHSLHVYTHTHRRFPLATYLLPL